MLILNNSVFIDKGYRFGLFKTSMLFENQKDGRFFWIQDLCRVNDIDGMFKVGLWFQEGIIKQVQLLYMADDISDEVARSKKHDIIIKEKLPKLNIHASNISNYWDKRDGYSTIIIDLN
jgi:hypothetical protein